MGAPSVDRIRALHFAPCSRSPLVLVVVEALIIFSDLVLCRIDPGSFTPSPSQIRT